MPTIATLLVVVQLAAIYAVPPPFPSITDVAQDRWAAVGQTAEERLEQLAREQGHQFKLERIENVEEQQIAGHRYCVKGDFKNSSGEIVQCTLDLWRASLDNFEEYNLYCGEDEYRWSNGLRSK